MPELRAGETQLEQSDKEIASWRLNHAGHWQEQTEPPLSIFYLKTKVGGKSADMKPVRLRLILVSAADVRGAESWLGLLKTCRDLGQIYPWMPRQNTESLLLWAYATDGDSRPFLWLGPKSADDVQTMTLRHCVKSRSALFTVQAWAKPVRLAKSLWNSFTNSPKTQLPENLPKQVLFKLKTTKLLQLSAKHFQASKTPNKTAKAQTRSKVPLPSSTSG